MELPPFQDVYSIANLGNLVKIMARSLQCNDGRDDPPSRNVFLMIQLIWSAAAIASPGISTALPLPNLDERKQRLVD
jgi:hypothetical protein